MPDFVCHSRKKCFFHTHDIPTVLPFHALIASLKLKGVCVHTCVCVYVIRQLCVILPVFFMPPFAQTAAHLVSLLSYFPAVLPSPPPSLTFAHYPICMNPSFFFSFYLFCLIPHCDFCILLTVNIINRVIVRVVYDQYPLKFCPYCAFSVNAESSVPYIIIP